MIEENTTSIFIRKSFVFFAQFLLNTALCFGLWAICLIILLVPSTSLSMTRYVLGIFAYFSFSYHLQQFLINGLISKIISENILNSTELFLSKIPILNEPVHPDLNNEVRRTFPVIFNDVSLVIAGRKMLEIKKLSIKQGQTIGIKGRGANLIIPLMFRITTPTKGLIFFGEKDLQQQSTDFINKTLGVIPYNLSIFDATISSFLDPLKKLQQSVISDVLRKVDLLESIAGFSKKIDEPIESLTKSQKQMLCLAKCYIDQPKIILIEKPHYEIHHTLAECIRNDFVEETVLIIGCSDSQFGACQQIFNIDDHN